MRIPIKGKGRCTEVTTALADFIKERLVQARNKIYKRDTDPITYILHYISGFINRTELIRCLDNWFITDNLEMTELMNFIDEHEKEWKEIAKDPEEWFETYVKVVDPVTGERSIDMPNHTDDYPVDKTPGETAYEKLSQLMSSQQSSNQTKVQQALGPMTQLSPPNLSSNVVEEYDAEYNPGVDKGVGEGFNYSDFQKLRPKGKQP